MGEGTGSSLDILLVEDNPGDIRLVKEALHGTVSTLHVTRDGREALDFLHQRNEFTDVSRPDIVLLDLNLAKVDGAQVFDEIHRNPDLEEIRLLILTSASAEHAEVGPEEIKEENFITKPTDPEKFMAVIRSRIID